MPKADPVFRHELEEYVICPKCNTLYRKTPLKAGQRARCKVCGEILYRYDPAYMDRALALSVTGLILLIVANLFPLVQIDFLGHTQYVNTPKAIAQLIDNGYYVVALGVIFLVLIVPAIVMIDYMVLMTLMRRKKGEKTTRDLLILLAKLLPWSMVDIFAVSILVALVKLNDQVAFHFGVSFWALAMYIGIDLYLTKAKRIGHLWGLRHRIFHAE